MNDATQGLPAGYDIARGPNPLGYEEDMRLCGLPLPYFPPVTPGYKGTCNPQPARRLFPWEQST